MYIYKNIMYICSSSCLTLGISIFCSQFSKWKVTAEQANTTVQKAAVKANWTHYILDYFEPHDAWEFCQDFVCVQALTSTILFSHLLLRLSISFSSIVWSEKSDPDDYLLIKNYRFMHDEITPCKISPNILYYI